MIFAIKLDSCQKLRKIWTFFSPAQILGGGPFENCTRVITPDLRHVDWNKFYEDTPTRPEVIWGNPSQFGCVLGRPSLGPSLARVKIWIGSTL